MANQTNTGSGQNQPFVTRFEMAIMQFVILEKASQGDVTRENLQSAFKGNLQMSKDHLEHCLTQLIQDGHLKQNGNKYTASDDGREDIQKVQNLVVELPSLVKQQGGQQRQTMSQTGTQGGSSYGSPTTSQSGGQNNPGQPKGTR